MVDGVDVLAGQPLASATARLLASGWVGEREGDVAPDVVDSWLEEDDAVVLAEGGYVAAWAERWQLRERMRGGERELGRKLGLWVWGVSEQQR